LIHNRLVRGADTESLYSLASERQRSGGSIGAIIGPCIEGNRRTRSTVMNRVDDSFE
jgi:hypothetical protein